MTKTNRMDTARGVFGTLALITATATAARAATYSVADLGFPNSQFQSTLVYGSVNASGQVVGTFLNQNAFPGVGAYRSNPNAPFTAANNLGSRPRDNPVTPPDTYAFSINDAGQVVGSSSGRPYRTAANGTIDAASELGSFGGSRGEAYGINAGGQAVGFSTNAGSVEMAFRTTPNGTIDAASYLGRFAGTITSYAYAINASGQVTGNSGDRAYRTTPNGTITTASALGSLGGGTSFGRGISDAGQVVGYSTLVSGGGAHAFRTTATGTITAASDLGTLGGDASYAYDINASGQTVGYSATAANGMHAFFVDTTGAMQDLNALIPAASGWVLVTATGINDGGQVSGYGTLNGQARPFLLTPVPEPAFVAVLAAAALGLRRRRPVA